jgi:hypothetical protein
MTFSMRFGAAGKLALISTAAALALGVQAARVLIPIAFGVGAGVWLAWRRIGLDVHQLRQRRRST